MLGRRRSFDSPRLKHSAPIDPSSGQVHPEDQCRSGLTERTGRPTARSAAPPGIHPVARFTKRAALQAGSELSWRDCAAGVGVHSGWADCTAVAAWPHSHVFSPAHADAAVPPVWPNPLRHAISEAESTFSSAHTVSASGVKTAAGTQVGSRGYPGFALGLRELVAPQRPSNRLVCQ